MYGETDLKLVGFTDFSFQSDHDDSKSVSDYIFTLNDGAIYWKVSNSTSWPTLFARQSISQYLMLQRKLYGCKSSSASLEWHPSSMAPSCYTVTVLEPLLKLRSRSSISTLSIFCAVTILSKRSWIEMMSIFRRSTKKRT